VVERGSRQRDGLGDGPGPGTADVGDEVPVPGASGAVVVGDVVEAPVVEAPVVEAPVVEAPVVEAPVVEVPVVEVSVDDVVDVGLVVSVVVGVVVVVVLRGSCTLVRGTQVYAGSGTKPGGTTSVAGACTGCGAGLYS
jgi:ribonuclease E